MQSGRATDKGDVYSYGVMLLELISGKRPTDPSLIKKGLNLVSCATSCIRSSRSSLNRIALWRCRKSGWTPFYRLHCNAFVPLRRSAPPWTRWCRCCKLTHCQAAPAISAIFTTPPSPTTKAADGSSQKLKFTFSRVYHSPPP